MRHRRVGRAESGALHAERPGVERVRLLQLTAEVAEFGETDGRPRRLGVGGTVDVQVGGEGLAEHRIGFGIAAEVLLRRPRS